MTADTMSRPLAFEDIEEEFGKKCVSRDCDAAATWLGWSKHGYRTCPGIAYVCDVHKKVVEKTWAENLRRKETCIRCLVSISGLLDDNLRWIKL